MPGSTPSRSRNSGSSGPVTPMSERQQLKLVRQLENGAGAGDSSGGTPPPSDAPRKPRRCNGRGETPLHRAAIKGDVELVQRLLEAGSDPNVRDFAGWTPLHEACNHGWLEVAEVLLDAGADVNARGLDDDTPLHDATGNAHVQLARVLVERGADIQAVNRRGKTPCDLATKGMLAYLLHPSCIENLALEKRFNLGGIDNNQAEMRRTRVEKSPRVTLKLQHVKKRTGKLTFEDITANTNNLTKLCISMDDKGSKEDVYEFKSSKEATPTRGNSKSPEVDTITIVETKSDKQNEHEVESSLGKRSAVDNETDDLEDESKRKKRKEDTGKEGKPLTTAGRLAAIRSNNSANAKTQNHTPNKPTNTLATRTAVNCDRKSPSSPKGAVLTTVPSPTAPTPKTDGDSEGDCDRLGPKVPPLKIVIPQSGQEPEPGGVRNGKSNTSRHTALPYVVSSNSNDSEKDGSMSPNDPTIGMLSAEDQKGSQHQRVLRSHRGGDPPSRPGSSGDQPSRPGSASGSGAGGSPPAIGSALAPNSSGGPSSSENSPPMKQDGGLNCGAASSVSATTIASPPPTSQTPPTEPQPAPASSSGSNKGSSNPPTPGSGCGDEKSVDSGEGTSQSATTTDLHPRKRKLKHRGDGKEVPQPATASTSSADQPDAATSPAEQHPHDQPVTNCYQLYMDIRKQVGRRRQSLFPVQPKPPQGFKDYLLNRGSYLLASNASSRQIPSSPMPATLQSGLKELFTEQERERHRIRLQHVIEKEKLVLAVEQEILRVHGRAARALANQSVPFSVCTVLRDKEVYNLITPEQEEKDRNARSRYNGRLFLGWLQDVDDKWEKIKEVMLRRHHNEALSLHAVQKMDWQWKMVELGLCAVKSRPLIPDTHVPIVHVSDDFDLLPV